MIPGCNKCEYSTNAYDHQLSIYVGWDAILSAKDNNYISADRKKQPRWITCTEADNRTMVNVMVGKELNSAQKSDGINAVVSPGLDVDVQSNLPLLAQETAVRSCDTLIPGCAECNQGND